MPPTAIADRVGWKGTITWLRNNVRLLRLDTVRSIQAIG